MTISKIACSALVAGTVALASGCSVSFGLGETLVGSGVSVTEDRTTEPFSRIEVSGALKVDVTMGEAHSVQVSGDDNIVPVIKTEVHAGTLHVQSDHKGRLSTKEPLIITVVASELTGANVSGACEVEVHGLSAADFQVDLSGASSVALDGECQQLNAGISGASTLRADGLQAKKATVNTSGASNAHVYASESIAGHTSGASTLRYSGNPADANVDASGASTAKAE